MGNWPWIPAPSHIRAMVAVLPEINLCASRQWLRQPGTTTDKNKLHSNQESMAYPVRNPWLYLLTDNSLTGSKSIKRIWRMFNLFTASSFPFPFWISVLVSFSFFHCFVSFPLWISFLVSSFFLLWINFSEPLLLLPSFSSFFLFGLFCCFFFFSFFHFGSFVLFLFFWLNFSKALLPGGPKLQRRERCRSLSPGVVEEEPQYVGAYSGQPVWKKSKKRGEKNQQKEEESNREKKKATERTVLWNILKTIKSERRKQPQYGA